jgi:hypothetical protein
LVRATATIKQVTAVLAADQVVAATGADDVAASTGNDDIWTVSALDAVVAAGSYDGRWFTEAARTTGIGRDRCHRERRKQRGTDGKHNKSERMPTHFPPWSIPWTTPTDRTDRVKGCL